MGKRIILEEKGNGILLFQMLDIDGNNIFTDEFIAEFLEALDETEQKIQPKVIVLSGLPDVFCGGGEKKTLMELCEGKIDVKDLVLSERLLNTPSPVIGAMEGHAMGGGLVVGLCCDIVIAAEESRYGAVFMNMGFTPGMGCTTLLQGLVGPFIANEMMLTGKRFKGKELKEKGVNINYILPKVKVASKAHDIAVQISEKNIQSLTLLKSALSCGKKKLLVDARLQEDMMHKITFALPETKKTIQEFYAE